MMDENTVIELNFNTKTEQQNKKFLFRYSWKKSFIEVRKAFIYAIIFIGLGFFPLKGLNQYLIISIFKYIGFYILVIFF